MESSLFDYDLPTERIAQTPSPIRDASRLLVVHRKEKSLEHRQFSDLPDYIKNGDAIFRNKAKVLPARLFAEKPTGGHVECLLLREAQPNELDPSQSNSSSKALPSSHNTSSEALPAERSSKSEAWWCLLRPGRRLSPGSTFSSSGNFDAEVLDKNSQAEYLVRFELSSHASVREMAEELGKMPLPPYIDRENQDTRDQEDLQRYQTVYADTDKQVAAAAPTAGLHFTDALNQAIVTKGAAFHDLILHVGMGTFKPLETATLDEHQIHRETYEMPTETQDALHNAAKEGTRRIAIGTTSVRTIEDYLSRNEAPDQTTAVQEADLFIYPPYRFSGVDALVTNFHLPKSTLLCLVAAFLSPGDEDGIHWLKEIYAEAIREKYRFLSYGDAMLIL